LSGRDLCDELITRPEESTDCGASLSVSLQTSIMKRSWPTGGSLVKKKINFVFVSGKVLLQT